MKIGYLLELGEEIRHPPFNGPATHIRQVVLELGRLGHQVQVLARLEGRIWRSADPACPLDEFIPVHVPVVDQGLPRLFERGVRRIQSSLRLPYLGWFESARFARAALQELPGMDIYYERSAWMAYGGALAARWQPRSARTHLVLEYNGDPLADLQAQGRAPGGLQGWLATRLARLNLHAANAIIATGRGWQENLLQRWQVPAGRVQRVENGSELVRLLQREDLKAYQPASAGQELRLAYLGGFQPWQGVDALLRVYAQAISRWSARGLSSSLTLIGAGPGLEAARQLAAALGLGGCAHFTGMLPVAEYAPLLAQADIGLAPYCGWQELSGLKLFDYKSAGLAIIASGRDGLPECLSPGQTGWLVPPCDEGALLEALDALAADAELRRRMGQQARSEAETEHGWEHTAKRLEQVFYKVLERD